MIPSIQELRTLLAKDQLEQLFEKLIAYTKRGDPEAYRTLQLLSARFHAWKEHQILGTAKGKREINQIRAGLMATIIQLDSSNATLPMNQFLISRNSILEKRLKETLTLLDEWEEKLEIAADPAEERRCELSIKRLSERRAQYQQEYEQIEQRLILTVSEQENKGSEKEEQEKEKYDAFLSFANEDKDSWAIPLTEALQARGAKIWCSALKLKLGDSITQVVNRALPQSRYGIVLLSPVYLGKTWPLAELHALFAEHTHSGKKVILPVWHQISYEEVKAKAPLIADKLSVSTDEGLGKVVTSICEVILSSNE